MNKEKYSGSDFTRKKCIQILNILEDTLYKLKRGISMTSLKVRINDWRRMHVSFVVKLGLNRN